MSSPNRFANGAKTFLLRVLFALKVGLVVASAAAASRDADLLLRGGTIYDGSGGAPVVGDVAVREGRIVGIGDVALGKVGRVIDCRDLVVAPGFIDLHTHTDTSLDKPGCRHALNYLLQGCTTMVTGNCGGAKDITTFFKDIDTHGAGTNIIHLVGHGTVRQAVMGSARRAPTAEELEKMKAAVAQAMRDGAWGMSTGLIYPPGSYAQTDELIALARVVTAHGGMYASHIRSETDHLEEAIAEAIRIGRESGAPVQISHFKSMQIPNWGHIHNAVALIETARTEGLRITADQYPYTANSFGLVSAALPEAEIQWCKPSELGKRMAGDREFAALVRRVIGEQLRRYEKVTIAESKKFPKYVGKSLDQIAAQEKIEPVDLVLKIVAQESPEVVCHSMSEADVRWAMALPWVATASDGAARSQDPNEHQHPRNFGTFARKIGRYAIQEKVVSLSHAIRSATGLPADIFKIPERGYLRPGYCADVVVFDPARYRDQATFDRPQEYATGVRYVFLAGNAAVDDGRPSEKLFGRALRHRSSAQKPAPFSVRVEADEIVCSLPAYQTTDNGSGMFWHSGCTQIVRLGDRLFVSAIEAVSGAAPLNNVRWALYERGPDGWRLCQRDLKERTREPCPLAVSYAGCLLMSTNPTLSPLVPWPLAPGMKPTGGPARPAFLKFEPPHPEREPKHLVPQWTGDPEFTEHSYRAFAADGSRGEFILFNKAGYEHTEWAFLDRAGAWRTGRLAWPQGEDAKYAVWRRSCTPVNYANVILSNRQVYYIGQSPFNIWNRIDPAKTETWGRDKWGWRMRKLHYAWTPDITSQPFSAWTVLDETMDDGGTVGLGDSWLAPDGRLHLVWQKQPIHPELRDRYFPDIKRDWRICYGVVERGRVILKRVILSGGETTAPLCPKGQIGHPRFHVTPDHTLYILCKIEGATPETKAQTGTYAMCVERDGSVSPPVRIPLQRPITEAFFTATPRAGNRLTDAADLLISETDGRVARYARISFCPSGGQ